MEDITYGAQKDFANVICKLKCLPEFDDMWNITAIALYASYIAKGDCNHQHELYKDGHRCRQKLNKTVEFVRGLNSSR